MSAAGTPSSKLDQYIARLPDGMRSRIKDRAAKAGRSMNAEIVLALNAHLDGASGLTARDVFAAAAINALMQTVGDDPSPNAMPFQTSLECAFAIADAMMAERERKT